MSEVQQFADEGVMGRRYEYPDRTVLVADFGVAGESSVDLVGGTVIVVSGEDQFEFDIPAGASRASMNNGVLTVEIAHPDAEVAN